jgi:hypothetical protein
MALTLSQKVAFQIGGVVLLFALSLGLRRLGFEGASYAVGAIGVLLGFNTIFTGTRALSHGLSGTGETDTEIDARLSQRDQLREKLTGKERQASQIQDSNQRAGEQAVLSYECRIAYDKTMTYVPNGPRTVDIQDGDFALLAKSKALMESVVAEVKAGRVHSKFGKGLDKQIHQIDESVPKWRQAVEEIKGGTRETNPGFDPDDYLRRLDQAFPRKPE